MGTKYWACGLACLLLSVGAAAAEDSKALYPSMAALAQYRLGSLADEVAMAQSAAPASISGGARVLTLGEHGYETAIEGQNGFVCLVERSWANDIGDAEFWNPKIRAPMCLNAVAAQTVLPLYLERTEWVLAGTSRADMLARTKASIAANRYVIPGPGAMCYMMSKQGYLSDADSHWHPHVMFFVGNSNGAAWGANLRGSPIYAAQSDPDPVTTYFIPVMKWSDGTTESMEH